MSAQQAPAESVLEAARQLAPMVRENADQIDAARELPRPVFHALADAGLYLNGRATCRRRAGGRLSDLCAGHRGAGQSRWQHGLDREPGHLGEPTSPPEVAPARGPPLWEQAAQPLAHWEHAPAPVPSVSCSTSP